MSMLPPTIVDPELLNDLPSPPAVAIEILRLADDPASGLAELAAVVERDPALSARLISISNSATYARSTEVTSVKDAASVLGLRTLSLIALSFSLASGLQSKGSIGAFDLDQFWKRSLTVAAVGRHIARVNNPAVADDAFLVGLLSYLGRMVLAQKGTSEYLGVLAQANGWPDIAAEEAATGFSSVDVTVAAIAAWGLPSQIGEAIAYANNPASDTPTGGRISLGEVVGLGMVADASINAPEDSVHHEELAKRVGRFFGEGTSIFNGVVEAIRDTSASLDVDAPETLDDDDLLGRARMKMFEATMALADASRVQAAAVDTLARERDDLVELAATDPLTGLANRRALDAAIHAEISRRRRDNVYFPMGIVMIDIDHFKKFNDTYGHAFGDKVLAATAACLAEVVRRNERVYRYGGEEFILFMPTVDLDSLAPIGERLRKVVEAQVFTFEGQSVSLTVSVGVAASSQITDEESVGRIILKADEQLYAAKEAGRNCVMVTYD
jgi:diguanylate cyclase (GGDEF)-like protein